MATNTVTRQPLKSSETDTLSILESGQAHPLWASAIGLLIVKGEPIEPSDLLASFSPKRQRKIIAFMNDSDALARAGVEPCPI